MIVYNEAICRLVMIMNEQYPLFVQAARVAAHLHFAADIAKSLSLTAKNARAISARAGQKALGFRAITDFIEELAVMTMNHANQVNIIAIDISKMAANENRQGSALKKFNQVIERGDENSYVASIIPFRNKTLKLLEENDKSFQDKLSLLHEKLEETQKQIRSAKIISSTSKIEATFAYEFQTSLENIATSIENSADEIQRELKKASQLLSQVSINKRETLTA